MSDVAKEWCDGWAAGGAGPHDILFEMGEMTAEVISRTIFGTRLGRKNTSKIIAGFAVYQANLRAISAVLLRLPGLLGRPLTRRGRAARDEIHAVIDAIIETLETEEAGGEAAVVRALSGATDRTGAPLTREAIRNGLDLLGVSAPESM